MLPDTQKKQPTIFAGFFVAMILIGGFLLTISQANNRPPNQKDCADVQLIASLLPPHVTAFFGMGGLSNVENVQADLDRAIALLLAQNKNQFEWKSVDFDEIIMECQLAWRDEKIELFKKIQFRASLLSPSLDAIQGKFPIMPPMEAAQWLGEGILAPKIQQWKDRGFTPFAARLEIMRQGTHNPN